MLDVIKASASHALGFNNETRMPASLGSYGSNSATSASFSDLLASLQANCLTEENETADGSPSSSAGQNETASNNNPDSGRPFWSTADNWQNGASPLSQQSTNATSATPAQPNREDTYNGSTGSASSGGIAHATPKQQVSAGSASATSSKIDQKPKNRKEDATPANSIPATDPFSVDTPAAHKASAEITPAGAQPATNKQPGNGGTPVAERSTSLSGGYSNADLAFAVRIQGREAGTSSKTISKEISSKAAGSSMNVSAVNVPAADMSSPANNDPAALDESTGSADAALETTGGSLALQQMAASGAGLTLKSSAEFSSAGGADPVAASLQSSTAVNVGLPGASAPDASPELSETDESAPIAAPPEDPPAVQQPVKAVQVQITGDGDQRIDLKLMEKSGSLTMSVRSRDTSLTKALQQNLPELTTKLNDQQIRAEWWRPDAQTDIRQQTSDSSSLSQNSTAGNQGGNSDNPNRDNSGSQGGRDGAPPPDWLEELSSPQKSIQNGTQYAWHL